MSKVVPKFSDKVRQKRLSKVTYALFDFFHEDRYFFLATGFCLVFSFFFHSYTRMAMAFGFVLSSYGVIANDSIQTLGLFITANIHKRSTLLMWSLISLVFAITMLGSWFYYDGDISYGRLAVRGLGEDPKSISFLQLAGPILLPLLTRFRIPVSTTFFLLNSFTNDADMMWKMISKSLLGYVVGFGATFLFRAPLSLLGYTSPKGKPYKFWVPLQWLCTSLLWAAWLMQDAANLGVFLPRKMGVLLLLGFIGFVCFLLGLLFYTRGGDMQVIVAEKTGVTDIRSATMITFFYMVILFMFTWISRIPMSTTFVFIGVLGGRELARGLGQPDWKLGVKKSYFLIRRDLKYSCIGLVMAIGLSCLVNPAIQKSFVSSLHRVLGIA